jgi:hypothetical protein
LKPPKAARNKAGELGQLINVLDSLKYTVIGLRAHLIADCPIGGTRQGVSEKYSPRGL